jgi:hypothetical protein
MTSVSDKRIQYGHFLIQPQCPGHSDVARAPRFQFPHLAIRHRCHYPEAGIHLRFLGT